jgi:riboflavin synthase
MFTGIVEELGSLAQRDGMRFTFSASVVTQDAKVGDSIAVNGCCLTVVEFGAQWWSTDVTDETLTRTNLGELAVGDPVNLERPLQFSARIGGHLVQGHVDAVGAIVQPAPDLVVRIPEHLMRYVVEKGSIAVDGISLTAFDLTANTFSVAVIPHTSAVTTLGQRGVGAAVNIEVDVLGKHLERLASAHLLNA